MDACVRITGFQTPKMIFEKSDFLQFLLFLVVCQFHYPQPQLRQDDPRLPEGHQQITPFKVVWK